MDALVQNPALQLFGLTYLILVLKMVAVGWSTSFYRIRDKQFATPEDYALQGLKPKSTVHEDIERTRRAHRNDLENILPYFGVGLLYALTNPSITSARVFFIGYTVARVLHSICYLASLQPWRTIAFMVAQVMMIVMAVMTLLRLA